MPVEPREYSTPHERPVKSTPWGPSQDMTVYGDGITFYSTAGHGGFLLSADRRRRLPPELGAFATFAGGNWYEEDQDCLIVYLAFHEMWPDEHAWSCVNEARRLITRSREERATGKARDGLGEHLEMFFATPASHAVQSRADAWEVAHHDWFVRSSCGSTEHGLGLDGWWQHLNPIKGGESRSVYMTRREWREAGRYLSPEQAAAYPDYATVVREARAKKKAREQAQPDNVDYGGVLTAAGYVVSDADPGL